MIHVDNVSKTYGKQEVLTNVTAMFEKGMIYGLVGVNGSGKTTLMRCICGFTKPSSGRVLIDGKQIGKDVDFAPGTGIMIENPGFLPQFSAYRNLSILANISGVHDKRLIRDTIAKLGLDPDDKKPVGQYSLGMRQRLGIAQALLENPDYLILDEPFNGLDRTAMDEIHRLLKELKMEGKTIILASHSMLDIQKACDTIYEMRNGVVLPVTNLPFCVL